MEVPAITYRIQNAKNLLHRKLDLCVIVIFEFMGTLLFTYCTLNLITLKKQAKSQNSQGFIVYEFVDFSLAMLMCISFTRQFAGAVYNPAIVIFRMLRRTDWYPLRVGILYIVSQFAGAICGGFIALYLNDAYAAPITRSQLPASNQASRFGCEMLGSFIMAFMVQMITEKSITFIQHNREFYVVIPIFYLIARTYSASMNCLNPAFGLTFELIYCFKMGDWQIMKMSYIVIFGPIAGALVALFFFECLFKPLYPIKREFATAMQEARSHRKVIKIRQMEDMISMKYRWSPSEVLNLDKVPAVGDEHRFQSIRFEQINDQVPSDDEERQSLSSKQQGEQFAMKIFPIASLRESLAEQPFTLEITNEI